MTTKQVDGAHGGKTPGGSAVYLYLMAIIQ